MCVYHIMRQKEEDDDSRLAIDTLFIGDLSKASSSSSSSSSNNHQIPFLNLSIITEIDRYAPS